MTARPILFSGPMVRALLEGRKTQTRRVVKPRADKTFGPRCVLQPHEIAGEVNGGKYQNCPYGQPGDLLWVRETCLEDADEYDYMLSSTHPFYKGAGWIYRASVDDPQISPPGGWTSAIHMPRRASRLTLRITDVRVQRLQDINEADARAEGIEQCEGGAFDYALQLWAQGMSPRGSFLTLWQSINGADSWDANPYVWVLTFDVIKVNVDQVQP